MAKFVYQARNSAGASDSGTLLANDINEASHLLRKDGKIVISLHEAPSLTDETQVAHAPTKKVKRDSIIFFATQLAVMVDTGVPLTEALDSIVEQTDHSGMRAMVLDISEQVKSGVEFSGALEKYPKVFNKLFIALMKASEVSGTMGKMLQRVSEYMEQDRETRKKVKGAMIYPVCMLSFCMLVVVGLLVFVLPRFEKIYAGKGAALPLPTRILLGLSAGILSYWPFILGGLTALCVGGYLYFRTPGGKKFLDWVRINMPIIGSMYRKACLARSLRTMATMISTGVSILEGLAITAQVAGNYFYSNIWLGLSQRVQEGSTLSEQLFQCPLVPRSLSQMIAAGERTGRLATVMERVAGFCEDDLKVAVKTVTQMIEPVMIIMMGLIIGGIAMALLLPVFSVSKMMAK